MNDEGRNLEYKRQVSRDERFERSVVALAANTAKDKWAKGMV